MKWKTYTLLCCSLLLCFIFGIGINTKCNAMTQEDVIEYLQQTNQNFNMSINQFQNVNKLINSTDFINNVNDTYLENFTQVIIRAWDGGGYTLYFFDSTTPTFELISVTGVNPPINDKVWRINSNYSSVTYLAYEYNSNGDYYYLNTSGTNFTIRTTNNNFTSPTTAMFYTGTLYTNNNTWVGYNIYNYIIPHNITFDGNTYTADVRVGEYYNVNNITYKLYMVQDNVETEIPFSYTINYQSGIYGQVGLFNITNLGVLNNASCRLKMYNNTDLLYTSKLFNITSSGNQGDTSGEQGGNGNISLTETNNLITNLTNVVESGNNKIIATLESGEKKAEERDNFWKETYNNLFTISGDYITQKFEEIRQQYNISGDYEIEQQFINQIQEQADDFIISWGTLTTHFSYGNYEQRTSQVIIPSGDINFSKLERENEDLHNSMEWARTIIGFSLGLLLLRNYWTTLLLMLGIGIQVYDKEPTEKEAVTTQTITIDKKGNKTMTETTKVGNLTIRRKK